MVVVISSVGLLFIKPQNPPSEEPLVDGLTAKVVAALREAEAGVFVQGQFLPGASPKGMHLCSCRAASTAQDYRLPGGEVTNSLAGHYLAWHRSEVPPLQLARVGKLPVPCAHPTADELVTPPGRR